MSVNLDFDPDVDYARGYYDGIHRLPPAHIEVNYLKGHEDGFHDQKEMPAWSKEYERAVARAYTLWMDTKEGTHFYEALQ